MMRIDCATYRKTTCWKCERYALGKESSMLKLGMCVASKGDIYKCARARMMGKEAEHGQ